MPCWICDLGDINGKPLREMLVLSGVDLLSELFGCLFYKNIIDLVDVSCAHCKDDIAGLSIFDYEIRCGIKSGNTGRALDHIGELL